MPPDLIMFLQIVLGTWGLLWFHMNFSVFSISVKNAIEILRGISLNL